MTLKKVVLSQNHPKGKSDHQEASGSKSTVIFGNNKFSEHLKNLFKSTKSENLDSDPRYPPFA